MTNEEGALRHRRGVTEVPGLYFLGLSWQHTRGSALLGFIADDAAFIAARIGGRGEPAPSRTTLAPRTQRAPRKGLRKWNITRITNITGTSTASRSSIISRRRRRACQATAPQVVELGDRDSFELRIAPVAKRLGDDTVRMIALQRLGTRSGDRVREGSELVVDVVNEGDLEATVHWHGLRLENRYDVTHETQAPIPWAAASPTASRSLIPVSTGTTCTSARTTARSWGSTATSSWFRPSATTGRPPTASCS